MGSYLYCPKCNEYLGSLGGNSCSCGWEEAPFEEPQQRTWVGLTDEEAMELMKQTPHLTIGGLLAVENKLKEKNA
jgi:hypothetical protein